MTDLMFSSPKKSLYYEFGSHEFQFLKAPSTCAIFISEFVSEEFQFLKAPSPCAILIGMGHLYLMVYCILWILVPQ